VFARAFSFRIVFGAARKLRLRQELVNLQNFTKLNKAEYQKSREKPVFMRLSGLFLIYPACSWGYE
jgi:hypothetical protein